MITFYKSSSEEKWNVFQFSKTFLFKLSWERIIDTKWNASSQPANIIWKSVFIQSQQLMRKTAYNEINYIQNALMKILITFNFHIIKSKMHRDFRWEEVCVSVGRYVFDVLLKNTFCICCRPPWSPPVLTLSWADTICCPFGVSRPEAWRGLQPEQEESPSNIRDKLTSGVQKIKKCFLSLHQFFLKNKLSKKSYFFSLSFLCKINRENM